MKVKVSKLRSLQFLMGLVFVYCLLMTSQFPSFLRFIEKTRPPSRFLHETSKETLPKITSNLVFLTRENDNTSFYKTAMHAWIKGGELWAKGSELSPRNAVEKRDQNETFRCEENVSVKKREFSGEVRMPCGMKIGSYVTVVGQPKRGPKVTEIVRSVFKSQFMVEFRRENTRLMHFNPRISGAFGFNPVIEMNTCYRGQWGTPVRCTGSRSLPRVDTVDGQVKCEKWKRDYVHSSLEESMSNELLDRFMGREKKAEKEMPFPFSETKLFALTITTGLEGYHFSANGRHIASFAYRNGNDLDDSMTLNVYGDVDVHSVFVGSLPTSDPSIAHKRHLEMSPKWKARPLPGKPIILFIGVISAADHFAERMAVRKSWMQHYMVKSSNVVARFFVALSERETINAELKKEAEFFGDIIVVPYLDNYDLVVLKTLAICEYGVNMLSTKYIMKCDDDTFVRVDAVIKEAMKVSDGKSLYIGKINYFHEPLRKDEKWAVTHEEWPDKVYPPYADGPGYIVSSDIARFIMSEFQKTRLKLFKMEDVSMGIWIEQFNKTRPVEYMHNEHFHQSGCSDGYITAHYQSPKQLVCLWEKLQSEGKPKCCNL